MELYIYITIAIVISATVLALLIKYCCSGKDKKAEYDSIKMDKIKDKLTVESKEKIKNVQIHN